MFDIIALGFIPIARAEHSSALMRGELMRYLAELAWAPDAILFNTALCWRDDGPTLLAVSTGVGEAAAEVQLSLDSDGRMAGAFAPDRPRSAAASYLPTPWRGRFSDYRRHCNMWLSFAREVAWEINGKETGDLRGAFSISSQQSLFKINRLGGKFGGYTAYEIYPQARLCLAVRSETGPCRTGPFSKKFVLRTHS